MHTFTLSVRRQAARRWLVFDGFGIAYLEVLVWFGLIKQCGIFLAEEDMKNQGATESALLSGRRGAVIRGVKLIVVSDLAVHSLEYCGNEAGSVSRRRVAMGNCRNQVYRNRQTQRQ